MTERVVSFEELRADYRSAFRTWADEVRRLRALRQCSNGRPATGQREAEERVRLAQQAYRDARDRLAFNLIDND